MFPRINNRKAISAVLTTIIILVASIVLGTGVVVYSTSLFQSGGQQQAVQIQGLKTWVNATNLAGVGWGGVAIKNTGDKLLSVSSITVRGAAVPFTNWYADTNTTRASQNFQAQFNYTKNDGSGNLKGSVATGAGVIVDSGGGCVQSATMIVIQETPLSTNNEPACLKLQSGPVALSPGFSAIIYYKLPAGLLTPSDSGVAGTVGFLAGSAPIAQTVRISNP